MTNKSFCKIFDLDVSSFSSMPEAVASIITKGDVLPGFAIALNAEKIISAYDSDDVKAILHTASLLYPDGVSISSLMRLRGWDSIRVAGCDLWLELMKESAKYKLPVFILGADNSVHTKTVNLLRDRLSVNIVGGSSGYFENEDKLIEVIMNSKAKIITVALGSPMQELFIQKCRLVYPDAFYMGVGGTYDVFTGGVKRAPLFFQSNGLEWFYRLLSQPKRFFRQLKLFKFVWLALTRRI
jgi:UDP-N-acetyl-D-mannosaminouronate:lipid I N-acetyl-D-mannosaminouronosyltransferase